MHPHDLYTYNVGFLFLFFCRGVGTTIWAIVAKKGVLKCPDDLDTQCGFVVLLLHPLIAPLGRSLVVVVILSWDGLVGRFMVWFCVGSIV